MAATQPKAKQRFIHLDVAEVSLVGNPANTEKFITMKSLDQETPVPGAATQKANPAEFTAALSSLGSLTQAVTTLRALKGLQDGQPPKADGDKPYTQESMIAKLKTLMDDKSMPPAMSAQLKSLVEKMGKEPGKPVQKSVGDGVGDPQVELIHSLLMTAMNTIQKVSMLVDMEIPDLDDLLSKAVVQKDIAGLFTGERVSQLKSALAAVNSFLKELDPGSHKDLGMGVYAAAAAAAPKAEGADGASGGVPAISTPTTTPSKTPGNEPAGPAQGQSSPASNEGVATAIKKAVEEATKPLADQLKAAQDSLKVAQESLTTITKQVESVRGVSKGLAETGSEGKPVTKQESIFKGVV